MKFQTILYTDTDFQIEATEFQITCQWCNDYANTTKQEEIDEFVADHKNGRCS